jgi:hypothetical protein
MARDRFGKIGQSGKESLFYCTPATAVGVVAGENAIATVNNRGNKVAVGITIDNSLTVDHCARLFRKVFPDDRQHFFQPRNLFFFDRSARFALNATCATAGRHVAAKISFN